MNEGFCREFQKIVMGILFLKCCVRIEWKRNSLEKLMQVR
jgi:hypothetical protein